MMNLRRALQLLNPTAAASVPYNIIYTIETAQKSINQQQRHRIDGVSRKVRTVALRRALLRSGRRIIQMAWVTLYVSIDYLHRLYYDVGIQTGF